MDCLIVIKCDNCGKDIEKYWHDLPYKKHFFCENNNKCHTEFKNKGGFKTDAEIRLVEALGTGVYKDNPPKTCRLLGIDKCTECPKIKCDLPDYKLEFCRDI
jgi:hypothetical protein